MGAFAPFARTPAKGLIACRGAERAEGLTEDLAATIVSSLSAEARPETESAISELNSHEAGPKTTQVASIRYRSSSSSST